MTRLTNSQTRRRIGHGASALLATCALAAAAAAPAAARARAPQTFQIVSQDSWVHENAAGAVQDTQWTYSQPTDPNDPCSIPIQANGQQKIVFDRPKGRGALITIHPNGRVTPSTLDDPATVTRTASTSTGQPSSQCQGPGRGDGQGGQGGPPQPPGGTVSGVVHMHLAVSRDVLTVTGEFVPSSYGPDFAAVESCDFMYGYDANVPEKSMSLLPTHWVLPPDIWRPSDTFVNVKQSPGPGGGYTSSVTHHTTGNFDAATVTSMSFVLYRDNKNGPIHR